MEGDIVRFLGIDWGTPFQGGSFAALAIIAGMLIRAWIVGIPERLRAASEAKMAAERMANDAKVAAAAELADRFKAWRQEVHDLKNDITKIKACQNECEKALREAHRVNLHNEDQMSTLLFLVRLLITELERLAPDSHIVEQAKITLDQLGHGLQSSQSGALDAAEDAVDAARRTVREVKNSEKDDQ